MNEGCLCGPPWLMRLCWERQMQHHYITSCVVLPGCMIVFIANSKNFLMPAIRAGWYTSTWGWVTLHKGVQQYWWMSVPQKRKKLYSSSQQTWRSYLWVLNCSTAPSACTTLSVQRVQKHFYFEHENTLYTPSSGPWGLHGRVWESACLCVLIACRTVMNHIISITVEIKHESVVKLSREWQGVICTQCY